MRPQWSWIDDRRSIDTVSDCVRTQQRAKTIPFHAQIRRGKGEGKREEGGGEKRGKGEEKRMGGEEKRGEKEPKSSIFRRGKGKPAAGEKFWGI